VSLLVGLAPFFCDSFQGEALAVLLGALADDDLPPPNPDLAARYAAMSDADLLAEVRLLCLHQPEVH
jgi:hypothetical protein